MLVASACQDGYPLEPTRCDDWCWATERVACGFADPAECVAQCEADQRVPMDPECLTLWKPMIDCYLALPDEALCPRMIGLQDGSQTPCNEESVRYYECVYGPRGPVAPQP